MSTPKANKALVKRPVEEVFCPRVEDDRFMSSWTLEDERARCRTRRCYFDERGARLDLPRCVTHQTPPETLGFLHPCARLPTDRSSRRGWGSTHNSGKSYGNDLKRSRWGGNRNGATGMLYRQRRKRWA